jgi:hypothetical protein
VAIEFLNPTGSMAAEAALYQPIDPTDEIEDVARQIMRCMPEERIYGGLVLPPNVDSFPGAERPSFQVSTEPGQDQRSTSSPIPNASADST